MLNALLAGADSTISIPLGLSLAQLADVHGAALGNSLGIPLGAGIIAACLASAPLLLFAHFSIQRRNRWAFLAGIVFYVLDAVIAVRFVDWWAGRGADGCCVELRGLRFVAARRTR